MKMKFLSVFCVVLYLHTSVTSNINNAQDDPANIDNFHHQNRDTPKSNQYISNESPVNEQSQKAVDYSGEVTVQKDNIRSEGIKLEPQPLIELPTEKFSESQKPSETQTLQVQSTESEFNKILQNVKNDNLSYQDSGQEDEKNILTQDDIQKLILANTYKKPNSQNLDENILKTNKPKPSIQQPTDGLKSNEQTRLELEGTTLEKIKNFIRKSSDGSLTKEQIASMTNSNLDKDSYNYLQYIISKAKKLQKIRSSAKELKRYMIVRPDGTVEHVDSLDNIFKKHSQYVAVKSSDLGKYAINQRKPSNVKIPQKARKEDPISLSKNVKDDTIKPNKNTAELSSISFLKENPVKDDGPSNSKTKRPNNTVILKNIDETLLNTSSKTKVTDSTPRLIKQNSSKNKVLNNDINISPYIKLLSSLPVYVQQNKTNNLDNKSSSPVSNLENIEHSGLWFQDRDFWEKLKSDARNVFYFLFVPSKPKVQKEMKTTIFANGTTVEEVTEIVDNEDGIPVATKTTKVTHADAII